MELNEPAWLGDDLLNLLTQCLAARTKAEVANGIVTKKEEDDDAKVDNTPHYNRSLKPNDFVNSDTKMEMDVTLKKEEDNKNIQVADGPKYDPIQESTDRVKSNPDDAETVSIKQEETDDTPMADTPMANSPEYPQYDHSQELNLFDQAFRRHLRANTRPANAPRRPRGHFANRARRVATKTEDEATRREHPNAEAQDPAFGPKIYVVNGKLVTKVVYEAHKQRFAMKMRIEEARTGQFELNDRWEHSLALIVARHATLREVARIKRGEAAAAAYVNRGHVMMTRSKTRFMERRSF
ncbi:hypothetical protein G7Y89_g9011 [Cudoniella acicularis]|uniref:Uncharacterized protein n=1 Tax=Cudoniella acicularis TaxID=354080 RepID=A0A8H4RGF2_9HELO|nr:hypothetical protein G7Y89_g9011 [Cudoniella acicularis]